MKWGKQNIGPTNQNYQAQRKQGGCLQNENVQENIKIGNYGGNYWAWIWVRHIQLQKLWMGPVINLLL